MRRAALALAIALPLALGLASCAGERPDNAESDIALAPMGSADTAATGTMSTDAQDSAALSLDPLATTKDSDFAAQVAKNPCFNDFIVIPRQRVGFIQATTTEQQLIACYGKANVRDDQVPYGEGMTAFATILFPGSKDEVELVWHNRGKTEIEWVNIRQEGGRWHTPEGIRVGTSLTALEKLNGRPFQISGWQWDYPGTVMGWAKGKLAAKYDAANATFRLTTSAPGRKEGLRKYPSDEPVPSDSEGLHAANPAVYHMMVQLAGPKPQVGEEGGGH